MAVSKKSPAMPRDTTPTLATVRHRSSAQQSLPFEKPAEPASANIEPPSREVLSESLWFCIHLPLLPLEALDASGGAPACAVFEDIQGVRKVLLANDEARAAGVTPGLSVNAAMALRPDLKAAERDPEREQRTLRELAGWAGNFTSLVSVEPPDTLLLELAGSLQLFGGLGELRQRISAALLQQGYDASMAIAPTPLASIWLARARQRICIRDERKLTGALSRLSLTCLRWPESVYESLSGMGVSCIGDCLRLPRQGFAKRFGAHRLLELDRALGRMPDPRVSYRMPEQFCAERELCEEQSDRELILHACHEVLEKLERFLLTRQLAVQRVRFRFFHLREPATSLTLGCVQADRTAKHWFSLLSIRFDRLQLPAPVIAIHLCAGKKQSFTVTTSELRFDKTAKQHEGSPMTHLVERLCARIGQELVHGVVTVAEHRPQYAWQPQEPLQQVPHCPAVTNGWYDERLRRPLWMLSEPRPLAVEHNQPYYQGTLRLLDGPERLETGWWDEAGIARDYFVAVNPKGIRLWVYQDRNKESAWYLHGIFG